MFLSGEASLGGLGGFKSTRHTEALSAVMQAASHKEESAEGIVVV